MIFRNSFWLKAIYSILFILTLVISLTFAPIQLVTAQEEAPTPTPQDAPPQDTLLPLPTETPLPAETEPPEIQPPQPSEMIAPENPAPSLVIPCSIISLGYLHSCAITTSGGAKCWGYNNHGQLGIGNTTNQTKPTSVSGMGTGVSTISGGSDYSCALTTSGGTKCWGGNAFGQLGNGSTTNRLTPVWVSGMTSGIKAISAGGWHACALTTTGGVKCWGRNTYGQLGDGTTTNRLSPVWVSGMTSGIKAISAGANHTCALTTGGGVKCWGLNDGGQLGNGSTTAHLTPGWVNGMTSGIQAISSGGYHTCALTTSGGVKCWGWNNFGQLGDGSTTNRLTPVVVSGMTSGIQIIFAGNHHTCALTTAGGVKCWGYNYYGQLGNGTTTDHHTPVLVSGMTSGIKAISVGEWHTCALTTSGGTKCWGENSNGEVGDGTTTERHTPVWVSW